jgi:hypothetical protein
MEFIDQEEELFFNKCLLNNNFRNMFSIIKKLYNIEDISQKVVENKDKIVKYRKVFMDWGTIDKYGFSISKVEDIVASIEDIRSLTSNNFLLLKRFNKLLSSENNVNRDYGITVPTMCKEKGILLPLFIPLDRITYYWWYRVYLKMKIMELFQGFDKTELKKSIAYTIYIYYFRKQFYYWSCIRKNIKKLILKKRKRELRQK